MAKITLDIEDKNLSTVLNILENLKSGLIRKVDVEKRSKIKPVSSSLSNEGTKKYISKDKYKQKLKQEKILEDEFMPKKTSSSKYLSKDEFKKRLTKG